MTYRLMPNIQLIPFDDHLLFYQKKGVSFRLKTSSDLKALSKMLVHGFDAPLIAEGLRCSIEQAEKLTSKLLGEKIVSLSTACDQRFDRLSAYLEKFGEGQSIGRLHKAHVLLLGVGGLGSYIFQHLMANGISTTIVDHDQVSESNLSRQTLYGVQDIGYKKVSICAEYAQKMHTKVTAVDNKISSDLGLYDILQSGNFDLIISTIDDPVWQATEYVVKAAKRAQVPVLRANSRAIGPFYIPNVSACPMCSSFKEAQKIDGFHGVVKRYQEGFLARRSSAISYELAFVALISVREVIHFLVNKTPQSLNHELVWDKEDLKLRPVLVNKTNCQVCE